MRNSPIYSPVLNILIPSATGYLSHSIIIFKPTYHPLILRNEGLSLEITALEFNFIIIICNGQSFSINSNSVYNGFHDFGWTEDLNKESNNRKKAHDLYRNLEVLLTLRLACSLTQECQKLLKRDKACLTKKLPKKIPPDLSALY